MALPVSRNVSDQNAGVQTLLDLQRVPMRQNPFTPDADDSKRIGLLNSLWSSQDAVHRTRDREIEEHVRMLVGQQWSVYNPLLGRWVDVSQFLSDDEKKWRQRPVFNRLLPWYLLMHARMTENPPIMTFVPGPDRIDGQLAETMDTVGKAIAREASQADCWDRISAWMLVAGIGYAQTRFDSTQGELRPVTAQMTLPVAGPDGQPMLDEMGQPVTVDMPDVPLGPNGEPLAVAVMGPDGVPQLQSTGEPRMEPEGRFVLEPLSPLEVRGEWGPAPWHLKAWHYTNTWVRPERVLSDYGIDTAGLVRAGNAGSPDTGEMSRLLYGAGYYGAATTTLTGDAASATAREGLVNLRCLWVRPQGAGDEGRFLCAAGDLVLYDGPRPANFPYTSPIRCWQFANIPGRQGGTAPIAPLVPVQRAYNRRWAQLFDSAALASTPKPIIDQASGLQPGQWNSRPNEPVFLNKRAGVNAVDYLVPPPIGADVWRIMQELRNEFDELGFVKGATGATPTTDASGELVKELRLNSDRPMGATLKRAVEEWARWNEDVMAMIPVVWPFEKVIRYAGDDNRARTMTLQPYLFQQGKVDVVPDTESMLPEGRGERQQRATMMWQNGAFGVPQSPQAIRTYLDLARFPHLGRTAKPGGVDWTMAEQENASLMDPESPEPPIFEWYDHAVHLDVHEQFMKSPEFLKLDPQMQGRFVLHRGEHINALIASMPPAPEGAPAPGEPPTDASPSPDADPTAA
jgi:hypothetical protein